MRVKWLMLTLALTTAVAACGDDSGGTLPLSSTTLAADTTTTVAPETTTTTVAAETTSTTAPAPTLGPPPMAPVQFNPDGIGFARFGEGADGVATLALSYFGAPSSDSGWLPGGFGDYGVCPGTRFRQMYYLGDTLMLMFSDVEYFTPGGVDNFIHYAYSGATPITLGPPVSIDVGNTVAELTTMWPAAVVDGSDPLFGEVFHVDPEPGFEYLFGTLTGTTPADTITYISGGVGCGE
ncbi:MAG: hypothetical protein HZA58_03165 [Acidimicrobiia bacterium]|nr:hypothetical protein [Acidimicrobiia bacterium]